MSPHLPDTLDFLPKMSRARQKDMVLDKSGEIRALRRKGVELIKLHQKQVYKPNLKEIDWIFYDILIPVDKLTTDGYLDAYNGNLRKHYPWKTCHWLVNFYLVWRSLRLHCHVPLPQEDATLFYTLASPFPGGFDPPKHLRQVLSFHKVINRIHGEYQRELRKLALKEILESKELTTKIIQGEIVPYKYTEIVPWSKIYDGVLTYLEKRPTKLQALHLDQEALLRLGRIIEIRTPKRLPGIPKDQKKRFALIESLMQEEGISMEEAFTKAST